jgi:hypothetical protein
VKSLVGVGQFQVMQYVVPGQAVREKTHELLSGFSQKHKNPDLSIQDDDEDI